MEQKIFCMISAGGTKLGGTATAFEDSTVIQNDLDKLQKQSKKIGCNSRWISAKLSLMHNQLFKYRMGTTDYKAVLQESIWGYSESEAVHESTVSCCCKKGICQTGTYKQECHMLDMWSNPTWCWEDFKRNTASSFWHCTSKHMLSSHRTMEIVPGPENMTCKNDRRNWGCLVNRCNKSSNTLKIAAKRKKINCSPFRLRTP